VSLWLLGLCLGAAVATAAALLLVVVESANRRRARQIRTLAALEPEDGPCLMQDVGGGRVCRTCGAGHGEPRVINGRYTVESEGGERE